MRLSHAGHQKLTIFGRAPGHGGPCERNARLMGYAGGPSVRRRCAKATAPQIAKSIGRRIYLAEAALGARSRRRRPFGAAGGGGAAFSSLPGAVWSPPILSPTANGLLVAPGTRAHGACKTRPEPNFSNHRTAPPTANLRTVRPFRAPKDPPCRDSGQSIHHSGGGLVCAQSGPQPNFSNDRTAPPTANPRECHLRRSPRTDHAEFQANRATTAPAAASHIKEKESLGRTTAAAGEI